jgi:3-oxoadipate enol-lactonase
MRRVTAGVAELEVDVRGSGDAVVFIHGLGVADTFEPVVEELSCAGTHRLIRYRRRGYGGSGPRRGRCISIEEHAADCLALLAALGVTRAHFVGHSYGGCVALQAAIDSPDVVSSLVLLEPAVFCEPDKGPLRSELGLFVAMHRAGDDAAAVDGFWSFVGGPHWREDMTRTVPGGPDQAVVDAAAAFDSDIPSAPAWRFGAEQAAAIVRPALHVLGSDTLPVFRAGADLLCSWLPQVERVTMHGANHLLHVQQPKLAAALIADFISRN